MYSPPPGHRPLEVLASFLAHHDLVDDCTAVAGRLLDYVALLEHANRAMNLIGPLERDAIVGQLICDSLMPLTLGEPLAGPVVDIGTGAGLPGVPLAIVRPDLEVVLIEPRERRYRFLGQVIRRLGLTNARRVRTRIEGLDDLDRLDLARRPGTAVAKAVLPIADWLELASQLVRPDDGRVVAMCSARDWTETGLAAAGRLGLEVLASRTVQWPDTLERLVAVLRRPACAPQSPT